MRRPRGPGGRFLTAAEIAELDGKTAGAEVEVEKEEDASGTVGNEAGSKRSRK